MKKNTILYTSILLVLLSLILSACSSQALPTQVKSAQPADTASPTATAPTAALEPTATLQTFSDAFAYCAAVGTIDSPDARYTGPSITDEIINGFLAAAGLGASPMPAEMLQKNTLWRCMDSQVYACNIGANLPCSSKANTDKTPSAAMDDYCKANPDAEVIPASVTGHSTIYSWRCVKDTPELANQVANVDAAGYLTSIWYPVAKGALPVTEASPIPTPLGGSSQILFSSTRNGYYDDLYLLDLTSGNLTRLTRGDSNTFPGPFSPDGTQILFTGFGLTTSYVGVMKADGTNAKDLTNAQIDEGFPTWSPDGKTIAFTTRRDGNNEIYLMNADGTQPRRLTNNLKDDFAPAFSPDGTRIAFVSDRDRADGYNSIYLMNADGSKVTRLTTGEVIDYTPVWSPDGKQIVFRRSENGASDLYLINADGTGLTNLTNSKGDDWSPAWSPDGRLIAFQANRDGNWEIYVMNADGSNPRNLTNDPADDQMPYWK